MQFLTRQQLLAMGQTDAGIRQLVLKGQLARVGRGRYAMGMPTGPEAEHLARARFEDGATLTLETAALAHGLPIASVPLALQLGLTGQRNRVKGRSRQVRGDRYADDDLVEVDGFTVTSLTRTVVDLARLRRMDEAIIPWEAALGRARGAHNHGPFREELALTLRRSAGRHGIVRARQLDRFASPWSESPRESLSRLMMAQLGLPEPVQQFIVLDQEGRELGRTDFAWPDYGVLGEYDGEDKYDLLARPGESPRDVMLREKNRQGRMEAVGWIVVRWTKEELRSRAALRTRVDGALRAGRLRGLGGTLPGRLPVLE